jgi:hypothetical protein
MVAQQEHGLVAAQAVILAMAALDAVVAVQALALMVLLQLVVAVVAAHTFSIIAELHQTLIREFGILAAVAAV